jgi:hypothetical protein
MSSSAMRVRIGVAPQTTMTSTATTIGAAGTRKPTYSWNRR